jgi:protein-disulfide isomerase
MKLTSETKLFLGIIIFTLAIIGGAMAIFSQPAKPMLKTDLVLSSSPIRGNPKAAHYLVEFSDFQCPACKAFAGTVDQIMQKNPDKLMEVYRFFPLPQHPEGVNSARAAAAAQKQGKFWEMGKLLFENQDSLGPTIYASLAAELKLDSAKFAKDMTSDEVKSQVQNDVDYGSRIVIEATPTFFLDGVKLTINNPADLEKAITDAIK